jgi:four helix bundle protein
MFDHERLDVYRVSLEFVAWAYAHCRSLQGADRHARDQLLRASQSIPLNIAEGNGKLPSPDRLKSLRIALGSALECGAILDVLKVCGAMTEDAAMQGKRLLERIVAMLTRMTRGNGEMKDEAVEYECEYEYDARSRGEPSSPPNAAPPRR